MIEQSQGSPKPAVHRAQICAKCSSQEEQDGETYNVPRLSDKRERESASECGGFISDHFLMSLRMSNFFQRMCVPTGSD